MNSNTGSTHRLLGLPGPVAAATAFAVNAWAAVPPSRGSPPGHCRAGPGYPAARRAARPTPQQAAAVRDGGAS